MRRTKEDSEKTKEAILDAAVKKFCQKGIATTTLSEIAKEAGVTRGAIYWHFKNKMDIFDALHERMHETIEELLLQHMDEDHIDPMSRLQDVCTSLLVNIGGNAKKQQALKLFWVQTDYSREWALFQEKHQARKQKARELLFHYFKEAQVKGLLPSGTNSEVLALSVRCYIKGIIIEYLAEPNFFDLQKKGPLMIKQFFRGLA